MRKATLGAFVGLTLAAGAGCSKGFGQGFEGEITMRTQRVGGASTEMVVKTKSDKLRFDVASPGGEMSHAIFDPATGKVQMLLDAQRAYIDVDFARAGAPVANTSPDTSQVQHTGKHDKVAGVDCETWIAADVSGKRTEVCIATGIAFFDINALKGGGSGLAKELREKRLFPLRSVDYDSKGVEVSRMEVVKIEGKRLGDELFAVPADYKKLELPSALSPK